MNLFVIEESKRRAQCDSLQPPIDYISEDYLLFFIFSMKINPNALLSWNPLDPEAVTFALAHGRLRGRFGFALLDHPQHICELKTSSHFQLLRLEVKQ
jgi:hypothetical protein